MNSYLQFSKALLLAPLVFLASQLVAKDGLEAIQVPGANIQRSMKLMAESTPEKRNAVRVLFFGQSITYSDWWYEVADDLKARYPNADLQIENHAIPGFTAADLIDTVDTEVLPFYPDLLIFHVYGQGNMDKWEEIIRIVRDETTADIVLWTHHDNSQPEYYVESERIRKIALRYNCGLVDIDKQWKAMLKERGLEASALLKDNIHLNEEGCQILASMMKPFFVYNPEAAQTDAAGEVTDIALDDSSTVKRLNDGSIEITFTGNRVDAIANASTPANEMAAFTLDGQTPDQIAEAFALTKTSKDPYLWFPSIKVIESQTIPVAESWELEFLDFTSDASEFTFKVTGSVTGPDGSGKHDEDFVSDSGRVVIPVGEDWWHSNWHRVPWSLKWVKKEMPENFKVSWEVYPMFTNPVVFAAVKNKASERSVTLIQGLANEEHVIRLTPLEQQSIDLKGFRVYTPKGVEDLLTVDELIASHPYAHETEEERDARMDWWREAKFGMFIHWGVYSVPAGMYQGKSWPHYSEWLLITAQIPLDVYESYAPEFNPVNYDPQMLAELAKAAGMKYVVITGKHHDGFSLYDSAVSDWDIGRTPYGQNPDSPYAQDLLQPLVDAVRGEGLKMGIYYSQAQDWYHPGGSFWANRPPWDERQKGDMNDYIDDVAVPQVAEILTKYQPDILWWDTPVGITPEMAARLAPQLALSPGIIHNDRLCEDAAWPFSGDTVTPEQYIPETGYADGRDWETCMTMNGSWAHKEGDDTWKPTGALIYNLVDIVSKGGNYLLNIGPLPDGTVPEENIVRLKAIGEWMKVNGESIYGTTGSPCAAPAWGRLTRKEVDGVHALYLLVINWPQDGRLHLQVNAEVLSAQLLANGQSVEVQSMEDGLHLRVEGPAPDPYCSVIKLELSSELLTL